MARLNRMDEYIQIIDSEFKSLSKNSMLKIEDLIINATDLNYNDRLELLIYFLEKNDDYLFDNQGEALSRFDMMEFMFLSKTRESLESVKNKLESVKNSGSEEFNFDVLKNLFTDFAKSEYIGAEVHRELHEQFKQHQDSGKKEIINYDLDTILDKLYENNSDRSKLTDGELNFLNNYSK